MPFLVKNAFASPSLRFGLNGLAVRRWSWSAKRFAEGNPAESAARSSRDSELDELVAVAALRLNIPITFIPRPRFGLEFRCQILSPIYTTSASHPNPQSSGI